ncbi:hypothetical protein PRIPAC_85875 [Pristionchus pacificus]|nr:hypothetical protein PRIPAC_85875 [Pristionchus pacificus]
MATTTISASRTEPSSFKPGKFSTPTVQQALTSFLYDSHGPTIDNFLIETEKKTGMKREQLFLISASIVSLYLVFGDLAHTVCNLIGVVYPSYVSVKAIRTDEKTDDTKWLIYWTVFGFFSLIDAFAKGIMHAFPIYFLFKALFLMYLFMPQTEGAEILYNNYVDPAVTLFDNWRNGKAKSEVKTEVAQKKK